MNFNQMVVRNTLRNKHLYLAYFLSTMFSVIVFFTFTVFAFHPMLQDLNKNVRTGMLGAAIIIYGFAFLFVLYSMDVFLQSRKKEFGVLMIQGMSPQQLRKMVFIENLVIGCFATICGSILGIGFSQLILWISRQLFHIDLGFYFPTVAFILTIVAFSILFLLISFFIQFRLPKLTLQELLKAGDLGKGSLKPSRIKGILAIVLIGIGYATALLAKGAMVAMALLPVIFVVVVGTRFLYNQLSVLVIEKLKGRQTLFWKKTNMVVFSDLAFRMKDNARSFFLVSIISTVAFAAIGTLYGVQEILVGQFDQSPFEIQLQASSSPELASKVQAVDDQFAAQQLAYTSGKLTIYQGDNERFILVSEYNQLAQLAGEPQITSNDQAIYLESQFDEAAAPTAITVGQQQLSVADSQRSKVLSVYGATYVVPDTTDLTGLATEELYVWQPDSKDHDQLAALGKTLTDSDPLIQTKTYFSQMVIDSYAPILFVGIFIGIVFFVSAGSFLYFRLYSDLAVDVEKFRMIYKLGLSKKELKKMINQQVGILFFTPIVVSFIHGAVALNAMYHLFMMNMQLAGWQVLGVFVVIQIVYYLIARHFYFRNVYRQLTAA